MGFASPKRLRRNGFVLVETLAAFTILALSLTVLYVGISGGVRAHASAEFHAVARREAQSRLSALGREAPLAAGFTSGRSAGGLLWTLSVEPYAGAETRGPVAAFWARFEVKQDAAARPQSFSATTLKLQRRDPAGLQP